MTNPIKAIWRAFLIARGWRAYLCMVATQASIVSGQTLAPETHRRYFTACRVVEETLKRLTALDAPKGKRT